MSCTKRNIFIFSVLMLLLAAFGLAVAEDYQEVNVEELAEKPQRFWARGIVFTDLLLDISKSGVVRLDETQYIAISTEKLGLCYIEEELYDPFNPWEKNREYIFKGMVLQQKKGLFGHRYVVVVQDIRATTDLSERQVDQYMAALSKESVGAINVSKQWSRLIQHAEQNIALFAANRKLDIGTSFSAESPHFEEVMNVIRGSVESFVDDKKTTSSELIANTLLEIIVGGSESFTPDETSVEEPAELAPVVLPTDKPLVEVLEEESVAKEEAPIPSEEPVMAEEEPAPVTEEPAEQVEPEAKGPVEGEPVTPVEEPEMDAESAASFQNFIQDAMEDYKDEKEVQLQGGQKTDAPEAVE